MLTPGSRVLRASMQPGWPRNAGCDADRTCGQPGRPQPYVACPPRSACGTAAIATGAHAAADSYGCFSHSLFTRRVPRAWIAGLQSLGARAGPVIQLAQTRRRCSYASVVPLQSLRVSRSRTNDLNSVHGLQPRDPQLRLAQAAELRDRENGHCRGQAAHRCSHRARTRVGSAPTSEDSVIARRGQGSGDCWYREPV